MPELKEGLAGVVVAQSRISKVFGEEGRLIYRGYDIDDLAEGASFEETAHLLWHGELPDEKELQAFEDELASRRRLPDDVLDLVAGPLAEAHPMAALRTAVSALASEGPEPAATPEGVLAAGADILAKMPTIVGAHARARRGLDPVEPDEDLSHAGSFLQQLTGERPSEEAERAMDLALVLHADHGLNASTFSARVTASTLSDAYSAVTSAIGSLKGDLHGGANANVMRVLETIEEQGDDPVQHVKRRLDAGEKIPGFGHRVYRTMDPRAVHLKDWSRRLGEATGETRWYETIRAIEDFIREEKELPPNVDLYSGSVYRCMGIDIEYYTPIFAMSRCAGWIAHVAEQYDGNRLIRPRAEYVGDLDRAWQDIEDR
ncbi:citrate synthase [Thermoplasmatales archaeon SW_10_69_26]|nr:MAG: citrate synthase [Thermoplasmatales archaeon SW_10_69_26]